MSIAEYQKKLSSLPHKTFPQDGKPIFYVCSYGGSGSTMLAKFLSHYGTAYHIHSFKPPTKLTYPIDAKFIDNFSTVEVPEEELSRCFVVYIFRNPTHSQISVYGDHHRVHQEYEEPDNREIFPEKLKTYALNGKNTLSYGKHYKNYMSTNPDRNYKIVGVNYHKLWERDSLKELFIALKLPQKDIKRFPPKRETPRKTASNIINSLNVMNAGLIGLINSSPAIQYF